MPHHWVPLDPGNPDCQKVADELRERYKERLKYVGSDEEKCWALIEAPGAEDEEETPFEDALSHSCARKNLKDWYVKEPEPSLTKT